MSEPSKIRWQRFEVGALFGVVVVLFLSAWSAFFGFLGWQVLTWLQSGDWPELPAASVGILWIGRQLDHAGLMSWATFPESWIGLHRLLDWISVGVALWFALMGTMLVFSGLGKDSKNTLDRFLKEREQLTGRTDGK